MFKWLTVNGLLGGLLGGPLRRALVAIILTAALAGAAALGATEEEALKLCESFFSSSP